MKSTHESAFRDLRPVALDRVAAERHAERRTADLAAAFATTPGPSRAGTFRRRRAPRIEAATPLVRRRSVRLLAAGIAAASAAVAVAVTGTGGESRPGGVTRTPAPVRRMDARTVLLASAETAAKAPATTGRYWYTDERTDTYVDSILEKPAKPLARRESVRLPYRALVSSGQETWIARDGRDRSRTITGVDVTVRFPTPADEAAWRRGGAPDLTDGQKRSVNDHDLPIHYLIGDGRYTIAGLRRLPTSTEKLQAELRRRWKADRTGPDPQTESFTVFVWTTAEDLLPGPITPGTRAALYRVLAEQPGIRYAGRVKDGLGRTGEALGRVDKGLWRDGSPGESRLVVDPGTGRLLANESWKTGQAFPADSEVYRSMGWVGGLSDRT